MNNSLIAFLPCRSGSERVKNKNIRPFLNYKFGLIQIKLEQLLMCKKIEAIYLSTNDQNIINFVKENYNKKNIILHIRDDSLGNSNTTTDELINHAYSLISKSYNRVDILWTHVTSPFINSKIYDEAIEKYYSLNKKIYDSLMTVSTLRTFLWDQHGPINYDINKNKWPQTQTLSPIYEINSGIFLANINIYDKERNRIGRNPYLYELDKITGMDIDWEEDFLLAESILDKNLCMI